MSKDKLRIIHYYPTWLPLTQTWMFNQVIHLPKSIESHIVCEVTENLEFFDVHNLHCLREKSRLFELFEKILRNLNIQTGKRFLSKVAIETNAKLIHSHFGNIGWNNQEAVKRAKTKHIVTFYGYDVNMLPTQDKKWLKRYQELFSSANSFLCEGPFMGQELERMGCPKEKVKIHHLGVEINKIPYKPRKWDNGDPLRILIAASFVEKKGIPFALLAISEISKNVPVEVTIIGDANPKIKGDNEKKKILSIITDHNLSSHVKLMGYQPYSVLFEQAYKHHIFISPSVRSADGNTEGGAPVTLIEMMATGMPVISTTHCDIPEVVKYGIDDWLVKERDVKGLVERFKYLIQAPEKWETMLDVGRKHVEAEYDVVVQGEKLAHIYQAL